MAAKVIPLEEQIATYKQQFEDAIKEWERTRRWCTKGQLIYRKDYEGWLPEKPRINWDENWDGQLIKDVQALSDAGFIVTRFLRKRKIWMQLPKGVKTDRGSIVSLIIETIGSDWRGISFKPFTIWWGPNTSRRW